jgi:hypothetical protein
VLHFEVEFALLASALFLLSAYYITGLGVYKRGSSPSSQQLIKVMEVYYAHKDEIVTELRKNVYESLSRDVWFSQQSWMQELAQDIADIVGLYDRHGGGGNNTPLYYTPAVYAELAKLREAYGHEHGIHPRIAGTYIPWAYGFSSMDEHVARRMEDDIEMAHFIESLQRIHSALNNS